MIESKNYSGRVKITSRTMTLNGRRRAKDIGRALAGIPDHQIRLSVGGEDPADVIDDLDRALAAP